MPSGEGLGGPTNRQNPAAGDRGNAMGCSGVRNPLPGAAGARSDRRIAETPGLSRLGPHVFVEAPYCPERGDPRASSAANLLALEFALEPT